MTQATCPTFDQDGGSTEANPWTHTLYEELRQLASRHMAWESRERTLQPTALVHEAWLRLGAAKQPDWKSRAQFFAAAAEAMRRILIDRARKRQALRHGGDRQRLELETWNWEQVSEEAAHENDEQLLLLNEALEKLSEQDPPVGSLVKLHYFGGMTVAEAASMQEISQRTAERRLGFARAWLGREMVRSRQP